MHRRTLLATAGSALAAPRVVSAQARARVIRYVPQSDLAILDPVWSTGYNTQVHGYLVFDTLYGNDREYRVQPQMLAGDRVDDDGRRWTLTLRDGLLFHDGTPVLARDCVASIRRWAARDTFGHELMGVTDELSAPDDRTVVFRLRRPFPLLPAALGKAGSSMCAMMPERLAATDPSRAVTEMVGSGPFRFLPDQWLSGDHAAYARFDRYLPRTDAPSFTAGAKVAQVDRVEWRIIPDAATAAAALGNAEVDWWDTIGSDFVPVLRGDAALDVFPNTIPLTSFMRFNQLFPPFDNPAIRRAVLGAVDQQDFLIAAAGDDPQWWRAPNGFFNSASPMANDAGLAVLTGKRDVAGAKAAVATAGYKGEPVVVLDPMDVPGTHAMTLVAADLLKQLGFNVDLASVDQGTLQQRRASQSAPGAGGWNVFLSGISGTNGFDPATNFALRGNGRQAWIGWPTSPKLEALRQDWLDSPDPAAQKAVCRAIQQQAFEDVPYVPLGDYFFFSAARRTLADVPRQFPLFYGVRAA